jgi:uncharacterized protein YjdB
MGKKFKSSTKLTAKFLTLVLIVQAILLTSVASASAVTALSYGPATKTIKMTDNQATPVTMTQSVTPSGSTVTYSSNHEDIVGVTATGAVYAVAPGSATITATAGTFTKSSAVTVLTPVTAISITGPTGIKMGTPVTLTKIITPSTGVTTANQVINYTVAAGGTGSASVGATTGVVSGLAPGTVTIIGKSTYDSSITSSVTLTVYKDLMTLTLNKKTLRVLIGTPDTSLVASSTPTTGVTVLTTTFVSSNTAVATVNSSTGVVTAVAPGTANITVTKTTYGTSKTSANTAVTVPVPVTALTLTVGTNPGVNIATPYQLHAATTPLATSTSPALATADKVIIYSSSDTTKATVSATGLVTGKKAGTVTITAKSAYNNSIQQSVTLTVYSDVKTLTAPKNATIKVGHSTTDSVSKATYGPLTATFTVGTGPVYTSATPSVATVNSVTGIVYGVSPGTSVITVTTTTYGGAKTATYTITVATPVTGVTLNTGAVTINSKAPGNTSQLIATPTVASSPFGTQNTKVTWMSSDPDIATVSATGLVTGKASGIARILVITQDGLYTAAAVVTVN